MNMKPKEKAIELVSRFKNFAAGQSASGIENRNAKECALIAVDEIIENYYENHYEQEGHYQFKEIRDFWESVKNQINLL